MARLKAFLDTNVLVDILSADRRPSSDASDRIFQMARNGLCEAVITIQSIIDAAYIVRRSPDSVHALCRRVLQLRNFVNIDTLDFFDLQDALLHPSSDFEDDVQFYHAENAACDYLVTSDRKFKTRRGSTSMKFCTPDEFIDIMTP